MYYKLSNLFLRVCETSGVGYEIPPLRVWHDTYKWIASAMPRNDDQRGGAQRRWVGEQ